MTQFRIIGNTDAMGNPYHPIPLGTLVEVDLSTKATYTSSRPFYGRVSIVGKNPGEYWAVYLDDLEPHEPTTAEPTPTQAMSAWDHLIQIAKGN